MARRWIETLSLLLLATGALAEETDREAELRAAVEAFESAFVEADGAKLESMLTDDYVHVNGGSGSVINRDQWLSWIESRRGQLVDGDLVITDYRTEDLSIIVHGDTGIVTGIVFSTRVLNGRWSTAQLRFSNTWLYDGSSWKRAAFHDSALPQ